MADKKIKVHLENGQSVYIEIDRCPDYCPICHNKIQPIMTTSFSDIKRAQLVFRCPNEDCKELFISYYTQNPDFRISTIYLLRGSLPWRTQNREFPEEIKQISEMFIKIYNESREAEHHGLTEICGAGYRKALEFLVKDYLIKVKNLPADDIKRADLGRDCINRYIGDGNLKACAIRAAWLGNDQTHYYVKWEDKDLQDLKALLELTLHWIQSEYLTKKILAEMPEDKSKMR